MRILHLVSYSLFSGPVPSTLGLALAQRAVGHTVWLACDSKRGAFNPYEEGIGDRLAAAGLLPPVPLTLSTKSTLAELWRDGRRLRQWLGAEPVDVLHLHMSHDHVLAHMAVPRRGARLRVRTLHAARSLEPRPGQRWLNRQADAWVVRCSAHRDLLVRDFGAAAARVRVVPGGIDAGRFTPPSPEARLAARRRFGLPEDGAVLGHVALMAGRGQRELLAALGACGEQAPWVLFVGRGEDEAGVRQAATLAGLEARVRFAGYLQGDALLDAYAAMDAAFVAQPGNDASARAALEAMACQLPVLAVQTGALAELVDPKVGYPVPSRDPVAIAAAILSWRTDRSVTRRAVAARRRVLEERSFAQEARRTLELYDGLLP